MLSSIRSLKRKWVCLVEKFGVFQQYRPTAVIRGVVHERLWSADTVEKPQIFQLGKAICVLSFLSNLTYGGDHIYRDLFLQSHC